MPIASRSATMSIDVGASERGIPGKLAVSGFWTMTVPPASLTSRAPIAPSEPVPVRMTATRPSPKTWAALENRWSTDGVGRVETRVRQGGSRSGQ